MLDATPHESPVRPVRDLRRVGAPRALGHAPARDSSRSPPRLCRRVRPPTASSSSTSANARRWWTQPKKALARHEIARATARCSAPARAECAELSRSDMKRATRPRSCALHRRGDAPRRLNVGFWVCAIWLVEQERAGRRYPFVWYLEDDVYLPGSWSSFMRRYDAAGSARSPARGDLLAPQIPYRLADQHQRRWDGVAEVERAGGSGRSRARRRTTLRSCSDGRAPRRRSSRSSTVGLPRREAAGARRAATLPAPPLPAHTNHRARR